MMESRHMCTKKNFSLHLSKGNTTEAKSHGTYEKVMSHVNILPLSLSLSKGITTEARSHGTYEGVMSHVNTLPLFLSLSLKAIQQKLARELESARTKIVDLQIPCHI